ncbi:hypothetical protein [Vibrio sp. SCSIO 43137]|uniref:hypothetical protein n=1 Tax=Vibrio sp. SCSIO 43137 TaxID=3021011 RepID=UPI002307F8D2|nr:hypothetical protein [Vibrio sp. SCSIO 43137]WCE32152.1 hypothetical protein PK654_16760 [Vibrio sp. SCSIO 43137]
MEAKDWITIVSVCVVVIGWFANNHLNRKHEIAKKRLEYRLSALESFLPVWYIFQKFPAPFKEDPELLKKLENARTQINLYGQQDEIDAMELFISHIEKGDTSAGSKSIHALITLIKNRIRAELGLNT